jgi:uncharacterized protein YndB with AHSA1/START domain
MRHGVRLWTLALCFASGALIAAAEDEIATEVLINAPVELVWKAWTTKEGIESWMVAKTEIDLRIDGMWRTSYSKDSNLNDDMAIHQRILAYDPGRLFVFRTVKLPKGFPFPEVTNTWTAVYFEPAGPAKTKIVARMMGFGEGEQAQKMRAFFENGNKATLDKLVKMFEKAVPERAK